MPNTDSELLDSAARKINEAKRLDLWDVTLTLNEAHALLHTTRAKWCDRVEIHDPHCFSSQGEEFWCRPE